MKYKLSALSLAMLPALSMASTAITVTDKSSYKENSVIVVYKKDASVADRRATRNLVLAKVSDLNKDEVDDKYKHLLEGRIAHYELGEMSTKSALEKLKSDPAVLYAEPNYMVKADVTPDDARFGELWGLDNTGQTGGTIDADIDAIEAWEITTGSRDVVVGVIDTGVDYNHPDLAANMWVNDAEIAGDGIDNDNNGYIDDIHGINAITSTGDPMDDQSHGTHVSGTIGAVGNNGIGVVGVSQQVSIAGCKFLDSAGNGTTADAIECIDYMVGLRNSGVNLKILNNSWGGGSFSQALSDSITASEESGILFVAAAGNSAVDNDVNPHYPSSYEHASVLSIANTTHTDGLSPTSQWGLTSVDMGAPGAGILSTIPGGGYASYSGTSMATPQVAGAAALVLSINPDLSPVELKELLMNTGDDVSSLAGKTVTGKRLNAHRALIEADPTPGFSFTASPRHITLVAGETAAYSFDLGSVAEWTGDVALTVSSNLAGASLSKSTATPGESFTLSVPTSADTAWGDYQFTITGTSGELVKETSVSLFVNPQGLTDFSYENNTQVDIPDNAEAGVSSVISISDEITIFNTDTLLDITHTWVGDLIVTLTSPAGTVATLHNRVGGSADNINTTISSSVFNGETALGDWTLNVVDSAAADTGNLNRWSLTFRGIGDVAPAAPVADFSYVADNLAVTFSDESTDVNGDIVSWLWDFGNGVTSTEQNPSHVFPETGSYDVSLLVTDSEGNTDTKSISVDVTDVEIELSVSRAYKSRLGRLRVDIEWLGTRAETVDIYRNGVKIDTVSNIGIYRDRERRITGDEFIYKVCDASTACSNEVTVNF